LEKKDKKLLALAFILSNISWLAVPFIYLLLKKLEKNKNERKRFSKSFEPSKSFSKEGEESE